MEIKKFEINKKYSCQSICDHDIEWIFKITKRTKKSVWIKNRKNEICRKKINIYNETETIYPLGIYSMCPVLTAEKIIK